MYKLKLISTNNFNFKWKNKKRR